MIKHSKWLSLENFSQSSFAITPWRFAGYFGLSGLMIGLPFANQDFFILSWFSFSIFPYMAKTLNASIFFFGCCLSGFIAYGLASHWIINFFVQQGMSYFHAVALSNIFWLFIAGCFAIWMSLYQALARRTPNKAIKLLLFVSVISAHFLLTPTPFPVTPAVTQGAWQAAIQLSIFGGEWVLMVLMLGNSAIAGIFMFRLKATLSYCCILLGIFLLAHNIIESQKSGGRAITFGWVQSNTPPGVDPRTSINSTANPIELELSKAISEYANIIVWPESGRGEFIDNERFLIHIQRIANQTDTSFVIQDTGNINRVPRNTALHIQPQQTPQYYFKQRLIPFGEYQPTPKYLARALALPQPRNLEPGIKQTDFHNENFRWRSRICFELLFRRIFTQDIDAVDFITLSSNQSWFASNAQVQLMKTLTQIRAIESGRVVLHVNNAGPSWLISHTGKVLAHSPINTQGAFLFTTEI